MIKPKGLGRGLDALLGGYDENEASQATSSNLAMLALDRLQAGKYQPRTHMDETSLQGTRPDATHHGASTHKA
jgi:ParB family transcriptional regulator, chromosome partitioning protein